MIFNSGQFDQSRLEFLRDWLPWAEGVDEVPGLYRTKDGGFLRVFTFKGRDPKGMSDAAFEGLFETLNDQLRKYDGGWGFWFEAQRRRVPAPQQGVFATPAAMLFDMERLSPYADGLVFETKRYFSVLWVPASKVERTALGALFSGSDETEDTDDIEQEKFVAETNSLAAALRGCLHGIRPLSAVEGDTYLHSCISNARQTVKLGDRRCIDGKLVDSDFVGGRRARLEDDHVRIITTDDYPPETEEAILNELSRIGAEYRYVVRWLTVPQQEAKRRKKGALNVALTSTKSMWAHVLERLTGCETKNDDVDAVLNAQEAQDAMYEPRTAGVRDGDITIAVVTWASDERRVEDQKDEITKVFRDAGFVTRVETYHATEAFLSTLPGHAYASVRQDFMSTRNCAHLAPIEAVWSGADTDEPLSWATFGSDPFRLNLKSGGVYHGFVLGETGGGKSVFLSALSMQWQRMPNARIIHFDKGASARISTLCCGGEYIDVGAGGMAFQPFADVHLPKWRARAHEWIKETIRDQGLTVGTDIDKAVDQALSLMAALPQPMRTMTMFRTFLPPSAAKDALKQFTRDGTFGGLLDANRKPDLSASLLTLEMASLMEPEMRGALVPTLTHIFQLVEDLLDGRPTLVILDECWRFLLDKTFAPRITQWLKELRKRNTGVILATQALADFTASPHAAAIVQSCKTRFFTPDRRANEAEQARHWEAIAMGAEKRAIIASAVPQRDYIIDQDGNFGVFSFNLGDLGLALIASVSSADHAEADRLLATYGRENFLPLWLQYKRLSHLTSLLPIPSEQEEYRHAAQ